jgi:DNA-binding NtrC family response regulator
VRQRYPDLPFILFTGQGNEEIAKQAILDDVTDYVEKGVGTDQYALLAERIWKAVS